VPGKPSSPISPLRPCWPSEPDSPGNPGTPTCPSKPTVDIDYNEIHGQPSRCRRWMETMWNRKTRVTLSFVEADVEEPIHHSGISTKIKSPRLASSHFYFELPTDLQKNSVHDCEKVHLLIIYILLPVSSATVSLPPITENVMFRVSRFLRRYEGVNRSPLWAVSQGSIRYVTRKLSLREEDMTNTILQFTLAIAKNNKIKMYSVK